MAKLAKISTYTVAAKYMHMYRTLSLKHVLTSILVRSIGMKMTKSIHMMEETGGKGTSANSSLPPDASWWKIESNSCSPVDILTVFKRDRAGVENGERYR